MRRSVRKGLMLGVFAEVLGLLVLAPTAVLAQTNTGAIRGYILDEAGQPVTAVTVTARNPATNFRRSMLTEETGFYNLGGLPPGQYDLEFQHLAYGTQSQSVRVQVGQTLNINVRLTPQAIEMPGITAMVDRKQIIEATTPEVATNITREQIDNLPLLNRNFLDFATLAPGVLRTRDGNSVQAGGLPAENINLFIDGVSYKSDVLTRGIVGQDASDGNPFPQNTVEEFRVITQNYKAEFQKAGGAVISATTKSGTNQWQASGFFLGQNENFIAKNVFQRCEGPGQDASCVEQDVSDIGRRQFGGTIGGPLMRDRLFLFASFEGNHRDIPVNIDIVSDASLALIPDSVAGIPVRDLIAAEEGTITDRELRSNLFFGKLTYQPEEKHRLEASINVRDEFEVRNFGGFNARSWAEDFNIDVFTALGKHQFSKGRLLNEAQLSFQRFTWNPIPLNAGLPGLRFDGILQIGGRSTEQDIFQDRWEFRNDLTYTVPNWGGSHVFKAGVSLNRSHYDITNFLNGNPQFTFRQAENFAFPFQAQMGVGDPQFDSDNTQFGIYLQDDWSPSDRLILNLGLRWDVESNMLNNNWVTPDTVIEDVAPFLTPAQQAQYFTDGDDRDPFYGAIQPRIGFTYDVTGRQSTVIFGGFGIFYDRTRFGVGSAEIARLKFPNFLFRFSSDGSPDANGNPTIMWDDSFLSREGLLGLISQGTQGGKPEVFLLENDTKPPFARQWSIGVRQALGPLMLSANYTGVRGENIFTWWFGNRNPDGSLFETPRFRNILLSSDEGKTWYDAFMFQIGKPFTLESRWGAQVAYTLADAEQNTTGDFTLNVFSPADFESFPADNDIRHNVTANWIVALPYDVRFSGIARFRSGPPISANVGNDPNNNGIGGDDFAPGETRNSRRGLDAGFELVDIRFEKGFAFGGQRIGIAAEVFNLFNTANFNGWVQNFGTFDRDPASPTFQQIIDPTRCDDSTTPPTCELAPRTDFRRPTGLVSESQSRRLQISLRYEWGASPI